MHTFEVREASYNFPELVRGVIVADDSSSTKFYRELRPFSDTDDTLIPLFVAEFANKHDVEQVTELGHAKRVGAIVTFGIFSSFSTHEKSSSHFEIVARELEIPLLKLEKPAGYPNFFHDWLDKNPLREFFRQTATVRYAGDTASISRF